MIVVASLFSKSFVVKMFSVHSKTQNWRVIQNYSDLKSAFEKAPFSWRVSVDDKAGEPTVKIEQLGFQISPAWCERRLKFCFPDLSTSRFLCRTTWWPCEGRILTVSTTCYSLRKIIAIMKQQNYSFYRK